jgi:hypothetical protein
VTAGFDIGTPNMARVYGYWLGGKDHYAADREEAERLLMTYPPLRDLVRENRAFVIQAVTWAARQGIQPVHRPGRRAPASPAVHHAARAVRPTARVAYVDIDPIVLSHARALLATSDGVTAVDADLRDPAAVLTDPDLRAVIDPTRPVAVILGAILHFLDPDTARAVTTGYARRHGTTTRPPTSSHSSPDWSLSGQVSPRHRPGAPGCPNRCCVAVTATCWPA